MFSAGTAGVRTSAASACTLSGSSMSAACRTCRSPSPPAPTPVKIQTPPSHCWYTRVLQTPSWWWAHWRRKWGWGGRRGTRPDLLGKRRAGHDSSPVRVANNPHSLPSWPWRRTWQRLGRSPPRPDTGPTKEPPVAWSTLVHKSQGAPPQG